MKLVIALCVLFNGQPVQCTSASSSTNISADECAFRAKELPKRVLDNANAWVARQPREPREDLLPVSVESESVCIGDSEDAHGAAAAVTEILRGRI